MKVGPKVAGECNFAPTFVRRSRFSRGLENSTGIFREVRFYRPRALLSNYRFLCEVFLYRFASLSLSFSLCSFVFDACTKKKFLIGFYSTDKVSFVGIKRCKFV